MRYQGKIVKWNEAKGFGFVMPKGGSPYLCMSGIFPTGGAARGITRL
jgi:cold shock CspA family protein